MRTRRVLLWGLLGVGALTVLGLAAFLAVRGSRWDDRRVRETYDRASRIIEALDAYNTATGRYPADLAKLVPKWLPEIKLPTAGNRQWAYWVSDDGRVFNLKFEGDSWHEPTHIYSSDDRTWLVDTK